jgi:hypothetical protein
MYCGVSTIVKLDRDGVKKVKNILQRYEINVWDPETEPEDVKMAGGGLLFPWAGWGNKVGEPVHQGQEHAVRPTKSLLEHICRRRKNKEQGYGGVMCVSNISLKRKKKKRLSKIREKNKERPLKITKSKEFVLICST